MCFIELAPLANMTNRQVTHHCCDGSDKAAKLRKGQGNVRCSMFNFHLSSAVELLAVIY